MPRKDPRLLAYARQMRHEPTPAEAKLWNLLRAGRLDGIKFTHQVVLDGAIPDFVTRKLKLIVELDGDSHDLTGNRDDERTKLLQAQGYRVIRFTNEDVMQNTDGVLTAIKEAQTVPLPGRSRGRPSPQEGGGYSKPSPLRGEGDSPPASGERGPQ